MRKFVARRLSLSEAIRRQFMQEVDYGLPSYIYNHGNKGIQETALSDQTKILTVCMCIYWRDEDCVET